MKGGADKEEAEAQIGDHFYGSWSNIFHLFCVGCLRGKSSGQRLAPDVALQPPQQMLFATLHTPWSSPRGVGDTEVHRVEGMIGGMANTWLGEGKPRKGEGGFCQVFGSRACLAQFSLEPLESTLEGESSNWHLIILSWYSEEGQFHIQFKSH